MDSVAPLNRRNIWCLDTLQTCREECKPTINITCNEGTLNYTCPCDISKKPKVIENYVCGYAVDVCKSNCPKKDTVCTNFCESKRCIPENIIVQGPNTKNNTFDINMENSSHFLSIMILLVLILSINI